MTDREKVISDLEEQIAWIRDNDFHKFPGWGHAVLAIHDAVALLKAQEPITGETSDGYHTFNELYHHRAVLFSVIVANYPDRAWKSKKHHDGTMYDNMFIVGIDTPNGQATYHYDVDPYWDMFKCRVLDNAPEWDGHTPAQAIERIGKLKEQEPPTGVSISSAIECLLHPQDADDSDMVKAIDTAVRAMKSLKEQEQATIKPKRIDLEDETKAWLDKMDAVDALGNIADICIDWDGYRTADGLGGLVNEIWAYARYCADRLAKAQEPVIVKYTTSTIRCPKCNKQITSRGSIHNEIKFCWKCGQAVKWK